MFSKILHTFSTRVIAAVVNLLVVILVSQYLGPSGKGEQGIIITTIALMLLLANFVGGASLVFLVPRHSFGALILPAYLWSAITSMLFYVVIHWLGILRESYEIHVVLLSFLNSLASIHSTILIGQERVKQSNLVMLAQPLATLLVIALGFMVAGNASLDVYIFALYAAYLLSCLAGLWFLKHDLAALKLHSRHDYWLVFKELIRYGSLNQFSHIFQLLSFRLAYYLLDHYSGQESVGIYSNGVSLIESVWLVSKSIAVVQYARIANSTDRAYNQRITMSLLKVSLVLSIPLLAVLAILPPDFFVFLLGQGFAEVGKVIQWLIPGVFFFNFALLIGHYFSGTGRYHINTIGSGAGFLVTLVVSVLLIPSMGIAGAGIAASSSYILTSFVVTGYYMKEPGASFRQMLPGRRDFREFVAQMRMGRK